MSRTRQMRIRLSGSGVLAVAGVAAVLVGGVYLYRNRAAVVAAVDPTSDKNVAYQAANKVVEAITGAPAGSTSVGSWLYDVKARLFPSEADRQVAEMLRATTPVVDRTILDAKDAWVKAGLHGPSKLTTPAKWSRSEWIALGGLALGLATHVANRKRHRG